MRLISLSRGAVRLKSPVAAHAWPTAAACMCRGFRCSADSPELPLLIAMTCLFHRIADRTVLNTSTLQRRAALRESDRRAQTDSGTRRCREVPAKGARPNAKRVTVQAKTAVPAPTACATITGPNTAASVRMRAANSAHRLRPEMIALPGPTSFLKAEHRPVVCPETIRMRGWKED